MTSNAGGPVLRFQTFRSYSAGCAHSKISAFTVRFGEIFAMVGPNGAGKSTLFNIISGIEEASAGELWLAKRRLDPLTIEERASLIGRSFQVPRLVPDLTVLANVMVRLDQIHPDLDEATRAAVALTQIESFGLGRLAHEPAQALSLGQRKLIDLTRAAVGDPPLVLLDEPAVGLTRDEITHLAELLKQLRARGSAVIVVEHNIEFRIQHRRARHCARPRPADRLGPDGRDFQRSAC